MTQFPTNQVRQASTWSIVLELLLVVLGMLAIGSPFLAAIAVTGFIAWLIHFCGRRPLDPRLSRARSG
jgi:uncharacterized membrane protein HdeD (DUF308 family)